MRAWLALDVRAVAAGRIGLAGLLGLDLLLRSRDLEAHYTDAGVLPSAALDLEAWDFSWSLHAVSGALWLQVVLFVLAGAAALALGVGYRPRLAAVVSWLLLCSLHARNPLLRDGQDDLLRASLLWTAFLPLGAAWSVDRWRASRGSYGLAGGRENVVHTVATFAWIAQLTVMYAMGALAKLRSPWWLDGDAVFLTMSMGRYQTAAASALLPHRTLLEGATYAVVGIEILLVVLVLSPFRVVWARRAAVVVAIALHASFAIFLRLGIFPWLAMTVWIVLWPPSTARPLFSSPPSRVDPFPVRAAACIAVALLLLGQVPFAFPRARLPTPIGRAVVAVGLQQFWGVFAPRQATRLAMSDGWIVAVGVRADDARIPLHGVDPTQNPGRPEMSALVRNHRWRHYFAHLRTSWPRGSRLQATIDASRRAWAERLCRQAQVGVAGDGRQEVETVELVYVHQALGEPDGPTTLHPLLVHRCGEPWDEGRLAVW